MIKFTPVTRPPAMAVNDLLHPSSEPVLGLYKSGGQAVVRCHQIDEDNPGKLTWYTNCSEGWDVTEFVVGWQALPPPALED